MPTPPVNAQPAPLYPGELDYFFTGHFYPHLNVIRNIPKYEKDRYYKSNTACNKFIRSSGKGTAGLFLAYCVEHGQLLGYHALKYAESTRTVHDLLFSRFPEAPAILVYGFCPCCLLLVL